MSQRTHCNRLVVLVWMLLPPSVCQVMLCLQAWLQSMAQLLGLSTAASMLQIQQHST